MHRLLVHLPVGHIRHHHVATRQLQGLVDGRLLALQHDGAAFQAQLHLPGELVARQPAL